MPYTYKGSYRLLIPMDIHVFLKTSIAKFLFQEGKNSNVILYSRFKLQTMDQHLAQSGVAQPAIDQTVIVD